MAAIVLGLCCVSSMIGGGYLAYNEMKKSQLEEAAIQRQKTFAKTPGLHMFYECDYKEDGVVQVIDESLPKNIRKMKLQLIWIVVLNHSLSQVDIK